MELDFQRAQQETHQRICDIKEMVLSTSANDRVTSRLVSVACFDNTVYLLSWDHHTKCKQIAQNPNVSFSFENMQMIGTAIIRGNALAEANGAIIAKYASKQPLIHKLFAPKPGMGCGRKNVNNYKRNILRIN